MIAVHPLALFQTAKGLVVVHLDDMGEVIFRGPLQPPRRLPLSFGGGLSSYFLPLMLGGAALIVAGFLLVRATRAWRARWNYRCTIISFSCVLCT